LRLSSCFCFSLLESGCSFMKTHVKTKSICENHLAKWGSVSQKFNSI
jgi:hypothetical protein